jgi:hypothetical protein
MGYSFRAVITIDRKQRGATQKAMWVARLRNRWGASRGSAQAWGVSEKLRLADAQCDGLSDFDAVHCGG